MDLQIKPQRYKIRSIPINQARPGLIVRATKNIITFFKNAWLAFFLIGMALLGGLIAGPC